MAPISKNIGFFFGYLMSVIIGKERAWNIQKIFNHEADKDYQHQYGMLASDIAIKIQKI